MVLSDSITKTETLDWKTIFFGYNLLSHINTNVIKSLAIKPTYYLCTVARNGWNLEIGICVIDSLSNSIIDLWEIDPRELIGIIITSMAFSMLAMTLSLIAFE